MGGTDWGWDWKLKRSVLNVFILRSLSNSVTNHPWFPWIFLDAENFKCFHPGKMQMVGDPTEASKSNIGTCTQESKDQRSIFEFFVSYLSLNGNLIVLF